VLLIGSSGRQDLDPTRKVVPTFVADVVLKPRSDAVFSVDEDLLRDLNDKDTPIRRCYIHPADYSLAITRHRTRRVKVDADLVSHCNFNRYRLSHE
jgi:hypothetical protein